MNIKHLSQVVSLGLAVTFLPASMAWAQTVIIRDTFNPPATVTNDINGRVPDVVQKAGDAWSRSNADTARTQVGGGTLYMTEGQKGFSKAALEFDRTLGLVATNPYTLSMSLAFNPGTDNNLTWYGGFGNATGDGGAFTDNNGSVMFRVTGDTTGTSFNLEAGRWTGVFSFVSSFTEVISRPTTSDLYSFDIAIRVDPLAASDNIEYFVNSVSLGTITYTGNIGGIWMKTDGWDAATTTGMRITNFELTAVPEPSTWLLLGLGLGGILWLRRKSAGAAKL